MHVFAKIFIQKKNEAKQNFSHNIDNFWYSMQNR